MHKLQKMDWPLLIVVAILATIGVIMNFSTTSIIGLSDYQDPFYFVKKQMVFLCIGIVLLVVGALIDHNLYKKWVFPFYLGALGVTALTLIPSVGVSAGGATRWLNLGVFFFQPVELLKIAVVVFVAAALDHKAQVLDDFKKGILPILGLVALSFVVLGNQPDLGNIILILGVVIMLFFVGKMPLVHLAVLVLMGVLMVTTSVLIHPYQLDRIQSFLNPWEDPLGKNYHITQSLIAVGSGGFLGHGFGQSKLKFFYLPLHYSDFVFSVICEEGGFIFSVIVLGLFGALLLRGGVIAIRSQSRFSYYLAIGLTLMIVLQALINIGVVIGVFPITGIPLTFISYGGSSFVMSMFCVGILLNISRSRK